MSATGSADLIGELEVVLTDGSAERRVRTLQRLSELLVSSSQRLSASQIGVFDEVLLRLLDCVGVRALAELSVSLAEFAAPPEQTVRQLARHQNPAVASPLLSKSPILVDCELVQIAKNRSQ